MITKTNLKEVLLTLGFSQTTKGVHRKDFTQSGTMASIEVDFKQEKIKFFPLDERFADGQYPSLDKPSKGFIIHRDTTTNFSSNENFVCLLAINALLSKGYKPEHIIIEPTFKVGHNNQVYGDILVLDQKFNNLILIENKTAGNEFNKEWNNMLKNGGQLFSYYAVNKTDFLCLLSYDFDSQSGQISYKSHIITTKDNKDHLALINSNLKEDKKKRGFDDSTNSNAKDYYKVWNESYSLAYTSKGLLEEDIQSYNIGKEKYTIKDLSIVPYSQIASIYNDFATILRNNAIGNYENTFYILVDLFLCKIVDELENEQDLQFYYKGVIYDSPFDYCDRLLNLYEKGIKKLFKKEVVNIKKDKIEEIFTQTKRYKGILKDEIEKIFRMQKFFNIKKFNFLEVENEEEFHINFKILVQIANLIQDFHISQSENNQFLGDLFEGFLNRSVHQTEGRFFTPTPITNFIIHSLPNLAKECKVLDFACGAGHFLTEFITRNKNAKLYGIEKNKDLSKVATTACIINNSQSDTKIIFQDALDDIKSIYESDFAEESFDLIISNPPYSVKGFLSNLEENSLKKFSLESCIDSKSYETNNAIECFFIERAKHFLKTGAIFALVLPVSILQKGGIYEKTREILLKHFQILAIAELNKRTFGSTGTQTIVLFAKKTDKLSDIAKFLKEKKYNDEALKGEFKQEKFLQEYCDFMKYDYDDFKAFLQKNILSENLKNTENFKSYFDDFNAQSPKIFKKKLFKIDQNKQDAFFKESTFFNENADKKQQKQNKDEFLKSQSYKELEQNFIKEQFYKAIKELEFEKMLYFSYIQDETCILIKSPPEKKENEANNKNNSNKENIVKFLGYDWSKRKGDEGIKYLSTSYEDESLKENKEDSDEVKKDKEALRNINSINFINTPLYNPNDTNDSTKLSFAIKSFIQNKGDINQILKKLNPNEPNSFSINLAFLRDMIDFNKLEFDKAISLNPNSTQTNPFLNSKYELVKLGEMCEILIGGTPSRNNLSYFQGNNLWVSIAEMHGQIITDTKEKITDEAIKKSNVKLIPKGTTLLSFKLSIGKTAIAGKDLYTNEAIAGLIPKNKDKLLDNFLFWFFESKLLDLANIKGNNAFGKSLNTTILKNEVKIPLPPLEIQKQIVAECEEVEKQFNTIKMSLDEYNKLIKAILVKCGICSDGGGGFKSYFSTFKRACKLRKLCA